MNNSLETVKLSTFKNFESFYKNSSESFEALKSKRDYLEKFAQTGFPKASDEHWKYTDLKKYLKHPLTPSKEQSTQGTDLKKNFIEGAYNLVIANGRLDETLSEIPSAQSVQIRNKSDKELPSILKKQLGSYPENIQSDPFRLLNYSGCSKLVEIEILKNSSVDKPIVVHFVDSMAETEGYLTLMPKVFIHAHCNSNAQVLFHLAQGSQTQSAGLLAPLIDVHIEADANLHTSAWSKGSDRWVHIFQLCGQIGNGASWNHLNLSMGGQMLRNFIHADIQGSQASVKLSGLDLTQHTQHTDTRVLVRHLVERTQSRQLFKSLAKDRGRSVFNGKIFIAQDAQQVDSSQLNKGLLLSTKAEIDTKPELEVFADDVKANHGATVGQISLQELFYLRSRGIPREEAIRMLARAFVSDVILGFSSSLLSKWGQDILENSFSQMEASLLQASANEEGSS